MGSNTVSGQRQEAGHKVPSSQKPTNQLGIVGYGPLA